MAWDRHKYEQFRAERLAPVHDLLALIRRRPGMRAIDLGCGTGDVTAMLADALDGAEVLGVDNSAEMLEEAWPRRREGLDFRQQAIEDVGGQWDLVFSNAAIHWVADHERLIPRLMSMVSPGGQLVVQAPRGHPASSLIKEVAQQAPFRSVLGEPRKGNTLGLLAYAELLYHSGGGDIVAVEKVYPHVLADADAMLAWAEGTALLPYMDRLDEPMQREFKQRYLQMLRRRWPAKPVFFGFQRMLLATTKT